MTKIKDRLLSKFHNFRYRHAYVDDFTDAFIATQIKVLREQRKLKQQELAELSGMRQSQISELEDVNNKSWKVRTLKKLAKAFDLVLVVRFEEFGKVLPDIGRLDRERLQRSSFESDPLFNSQERTGETHTAAAAAAEAVAIPAQASARILNADAKFRRGDVPNVA